MSEQNTQNFLERFLAGFVDTLGEDSEHFREVNETVINAKDGEDYKSARKWQKMIAENPTVQTINDLFEIGDKDLRDERKRRGMGLSDDKAVKSGQVAGRVGQDIVRDSSRGVYWLLNAPQAVIDIIAEETIHRANPDMRKENPIRKEDGSKVYVNKNDFREAERAGATDAEGNRTKYTNVGQPESWTDEFGVKRTRRPYTRSNVAPGIINALKSPGSLAINAGMGLMHYAGGMEGYEATIPSEEDPTKTSNVLAEIGAKYIVGRTGNLLPYDEFVKVRPDVSKGEYNAYKAFKYDKSLDLNPMDGDVNVLPLGLLKATADGIHGAEVQFLGRSLPVNESLLPVATAILGTTMGVYGGAANRKKFQEKGTKFAGVVPPVMPDKSVQPGSEAERKQLSNRTVRRGLLAGGSGYALGALAGSALEDERRARNQEENERDGSLYRS